MRKSIHTLSWIFASGLILFFSYLMAKLTLPYFDGAFYHDFLITKVEILHLKIWRWAFYTHISSSTFLLVIGFLQFLPWLQYKSPVLHRWCGKLYVFIILFVSGPSGLVLAIFANGGICGKISFTLLSLLWLVFTFYGWQKAKNKNFIAHKKFMYRSYALTLSAISLRLLVMILPHFFILPPAEMYSLIGWLSWTINLVAVELLLYLKWI